MNMPNSYYQEPEFDYQVDSERRGAKEKAAKSTTSRRVSYARTSRPAVMHNGIHRRRKKRFAW